MISLTEIRWSFAHSPGCLFTILSQISQMGQSHSAKLIATFRLVFVDYKLFPLIPPEINWPETYSIKWFYRLFLQFHSKVDSTIITHGCIIQWGMVLQSKTLSAFYIFAFAVSDVFVWIFIHHSGSYNVKPITFLLHVMKDVYNTCHPSCLVVLSCVALCGQNETIGVFVSNS